jgi:hypothetical protein
MLKRPSRDGCGAVTNREQVSMNLVRPLACIFAVAFLGMNLANAAELPSQMKNVRPPEALKHCNIGGSVGVLAANGVCVRVSGYASAAVGGGQVK